MLQMYRATVAIYEPPRTGRARISLQPTFWFWGLSMLGHSQRDDDRSVRADRG